MAKDAWFLSHEFFTRGRREEIVKGDISMLLKLRNPFRVVKPFAINKEVDMLRRSSPQTIIAFNKETDEWES